jgi:hypothetical protein
MGQKANILTLRNVKKNLNLINENSKQFLYGFQFLSFFEKLLSNKNIFVSKKTLNINGNQSFLNLDIFYKTNKITNYKIKGSLRKKIKRNPIFINKNKKLSFLFYKQLQFLKTTRFIFNIKNLNKSVSKRTLVFFYHKLKRFLGVLFTRRFNLFIDFLKITTLFYENKIDCSCFLFFIGQIFKSLHKRKHNRFLFFLNLVFQLLIKKIPKTIKLLEGNEIKGFKFIINGKLQGKTRATSKCIRIGAVPIQSIGKNIEFSRKDVHTIYGTFGLKLWIFRN